MLLRRIARGLICLFLSVLYKSFSLTVADAEASKYINVNLRVPPAGFEASLTQRGLQYASDVELTEISSKLNGQSIPTLSGNAKVIGLKVDYTFSNGRVTSFSKPVGEVSLAPGALVTWHATGAAASLTANWHYHAKKSFIKVSDHGSLDINLSGVSFKITLQLGVDATSHPTVHTTSCAANVEGSYVKFHGGASWLYNLFRSNIEKAVKKAVAGLLCKEAQKAIDVKLQQAFLRLKMTVPFDDDRFLLDYGLSSAPSSAPDFLRVTLKAETLWAAGPQHCPFGPTPLPTITRAPARMAYFVVTDYVLRSLAYQAHAHHVLQYNLTKRHVPDQLKKILNTTCDGHNTCVGSIVPQVAKQYPDCDVQLSLASVAPPVSSISQSNLSVELLFTMTFVAVSRSSAKKADLFTLGLKRSTEISLSIQENKIVGKLVNTKSLRYNVDVVQTNVGPVDKKYFDVIITLMDNSYLKPMIEEKLGEGLRLPDMGAVRLAKPELQLLSGAVLLSTDLHIQ